MHGHDHHCGPNHREPSPRANDRRNLWWVLSLSILYFAAELVGSWFSGSLALLADAGHMLIDVAAIGLSLFALWIARKPADEQKTYGYHRVEILIALVNGATLIAISFWIFFEAWGRLREPVVVRGELMFWVALGGLVVNGIGLGLTHRSRGSSLNMRGVWLHILSDFVGSLSAVIAAVSIWKWNWTTVDPAVSVLLGMLILFGAWKLVLQSVNVLLEGVPEGIELAELRECLARVSGVEEIHDLHVWMLSSGLPSLSAHIRLEASAESAEVLKLLTQLLKDRYHIEHVTLQLEPPAYQHKTIHV